LLAISLENGCLKIVVQDNGIGREKASEYKKTKGFDSVAMKLTGERLEMINKLRGGDGLKEKIIDLYDKNGDACGTRIELFVVLENEVV
jgi:hypothetical protein